MAKFEIVLMPLSTAGQVADLAARLVAVLAECLGADPEADPRPAGQTCPEACAVNEAAPQPSKQPPKELALPERSTPALKTESQREQRWSTQDSSLTPR